MNRHDDMDYRWFPIADEWTNGDIECRLRLLRRFGLTIAPAPNGMLRVAMEIHEDGDRYQVTRWISPRNAEISPLRRRVTFPDRRHPDHYAFAVGRDLPQAYASLYVPDTDQTVTLGLPFNCYEGLVGVLDSLATLVVLAA